VARAAGGAASATLKVIAEENLSARAATMGAVLKARLQEMFARYLPGHLGEVRGKGLLIGVELVTDHETKQPAPKLAQRIALRAFRSGLMLAGSWDWTTLIIAPPLTQDEPTLDEATGILETALRQVAHM
jgi:4-aminobutyrate aminotransferase-like enzyme